MSSVCCPELISQKSIDAVHRAMSTLQDEREQLENFVEGLLDELEVVRCELQEKDEEIEGERQRLDRARQEMERLRQSVESQQNDESARYVAEIEQLRGQLQLFNTDQERVRTVEHDLTTQLEAARHHIHELEVRLASLVEERQVVQTNLDGAMDELTTLAEVREKLVDAESELASTRVQLAESQQDNVLLLRELDELKKVKQDTVEIDSPPDDSLEQLQLERDRNETLQRELGTLREQYDRQQREFLAELQSLRESLHGYDVPFTAMEPEVTLEPAFAGLSTRPDYATASSSANALDGAVSAPVDRVVGSVLQKLQRMNAGKK